MKKKASILLALLLCVGLILSACMSPKDTIESTIKSTVESAISGKVSLASDGGAISTIQGNLQFGSNVQWPADKMGNLPKPTATFTGMISDSSSKGCSVVFKELNQTDAQSYYQKLKDLGYQNGMEYSDETGIMLTGTDSSGNGVFFSYSLEDSTGTIIYTPHIMASSSN